VIDNNLLYPGTPSMLQPSGSGAVKSDPSPANRNSELPPPAAGLPQPVAAPTAPVAPVLGNGTINGTTTYGHEPWGSTPNAQFLAPSVMSLMGMDTSGAQPGMLFNTQTQRWEIPPPEWAAMGGAHAGSFDNPAATAEKVTTHINSVLDGTHPALKAGAAGTTGSTTQPTAGAPGVQPGANGAYGTYGNLHSRNGATLNTAGLPDWLASQYQDTVNVDEGGTQSNFYNTNENPWGGFKGQDGQYYVQVGDPSGHGGDGGVLDPSKVTYDPNLGYITAASNLRDQPTGGVNYGMLAAVLGAGALGTVAGLGAEAAAGGAAEGAAGGSALAPLTGVTLAPETPIGAVGTVGGAGGAVGAAGSGAAAGATPAGTGAAGAGAAGTGAAGAGAGAGAAGAGSGIGAILNPAARILAPAIIGQVLHPSGGGSGHPSTGGTGTGTGSSGSPGTSNAYDALGQSLIDNKPLSDAARATLLNHGKPTDDQTSAINAGLAEQRRIGQEQILQASANSGQGGADSMVVQDKMRAFDTQLETQRQELMQKQAESNTSNALQELGYVSKEALAYAELQFREDESMQQLYMGLFDALGKLYGTTPGTTGNNTKVPGVPTPDPKPDPEGDPDPNDGIPTDPNGELQFDP
jgi:hypothetical protein